MLHIRSQWVAHYEECLGLKLSARIRPSYLASMLNTTPRYRKITRVRHPDSTSPQFAYFLRNMNKSRRSRSPRPGLYTLFDGWNVWYEQVKRRSLVSLVEGIYAKLSMEIMTCDKCYPNRAGFPGRWPRRHRVARVWRTLGSNSSRSPRPAGID